MPSWLKDVAPRLCSQQLPTIFSIYHLVFPVIFPPTLESKYYFTYWIVRMLTRYLWMQYIINSPLNQYIINR